MLLLAGTLCFSSELPGPTVAVHTVFIAFEMWPLRNKAGKGNFQLHVAEKTEYLGIQVLCIPYSSCSLKYDSLHGHLFPHLLRMKACSPVSEFYLLLHTGSSPSFHQTMGQAASVVCSREETMLYALGRLIHNRPKESNLCCSIHLKVKSP